MKPLSLPLLRARLQLMLRHPYLAAAAARLPMVEASDRPWCRTMATDGYNILINSDFAASLSEEETMGVLAHEILHCVLGHIDRRGTREPDLWNVAIDHATNLLLQDQGFALPGQPFCSPAYRGMTAEEIYEALAQSSGHDSVPTKAGFDRHLDPAGAEGADMRGQAFPSSEERRRLRGELATELQRALHGLQAGVHAGEIAAAGAAEVGWEALLARFVSGIKRSDFRLFPFNRRHLWRGVYLPSLGVPGPEHLIVAIDTSGSMGEHDLGRVLSEIDRLRSLAECRLTVIQCDAAIQKIVAFEAWDLAQVDFSRMTIRGRGGTDFRPVFERLAREHQLRSPDALICLSDGYGTFPKDPPQFPCLWIVPAHGETSFPFGEVIRLRRDARPART